MHCPFCQNKQSKVIDSRVIDGGTAIRRRRECSACNGRFTTIEKAQLLVIKRNGLTEPFSREKVITGVRRACQGRNVSEDALKRLAQEVEEVVRSHGSSQIHANFIGRAILDPLRELDEVATYVLPPSINPSSPPPISKPRYGRCGGVTEDYEASQFGLVDAYRRAAIALEIFDSDTFCAVPNVAQQTDP